MSSENPAGRPVGARGGISPARQLYLQMMSEIVAPRLAQFGFVTRGREFHYRSGDYLATVHPRPLRRNPPGEYGFEVELYVSFVPEGPPNFWYDKLRPAERRPGYLADWTVEVGRPTGPLPEDLLATFRGYGWPAIQTLLDDPGYPPDPSRRWARSFAPIRGRAGWAAVRRRLEQAVSAVPLVREALQSAAAEDEDLNVRWAARFALRLAAASSGATTPGPTR